MKKGYTLIELIVVIVIATILLSIGGSVAFGLWHAFH
jgi:prepilin-type N-terminal cleavage/methylation domain-containing protein